MNDIARAAGASLAAAGLLTGCANPFAPMDEDYGPRTSAERVRVVEPLDLTGFQVATRTDEELTAEVLDYAERLRTSDTFDLTIEEARALALSNNLDLRVALIDPVVGMARVSEEEAAFEALFFADGRYTDTDQPTASQLTGSQVENTNIDLGLRIPTRTGGEVTVDFIGDRTATNNQFATLDPSFETDARFSISHPLLRNAGRRATTYPLRVASIQQNIDEARTKLEVINQLASVERAYWRLYAVRRALDVRQQEYEVAVQQLDRARRRVQAGADPEIEIIRSESGVAQRLEAIILAQNEVIEAERELKRIMNAPGLELGGSIVLVPATDPDPIAYEIDPDPLVTAALANRMDLLQTELQLVIDQSLIELRKNQLLPRLDASFAYIYNGLGGNLGNSVDELAGREFADWTVSASLEVPLGNEGAESRLRQAMLARLQRIVTRDSQRQGIEQEVRNAVTRIRVDWRRVLAARQAAILAARTLQAEQRQFEVGRRTSTDVLDAAASLADAQTSEVRALADYQISQVNLAVATGTLLGALRVDWGPIDPTVPLEAGEGVAAETALSARE
ncbi:MAG: TolC family protein [Phycisphaerales bacterium]